jgi:FMN phosphatase YigB (HAD superfamily)
MTFLFDIGRVLLDFDFETSLARLLPLGTTDGLERMTRLLDRKDDFEAGSILEADYVPWAIERMGIDVGPEVFVDSWRNIFTPVEAMWKTVERLSADGHRLILFSNTNSIHCPWIFENYGIFRHFTGAVLSYETGSIKPHEPIYRHAIDNHGLIPEETLYIDDLPQNCETGRRLGFRTWQYDLRDHAAFESWLEEQIRTAPAALQP